MPTALDHGLAYEALAVGKVDAIDLYSTDAKIARYSIRVLEDDLGDLRASLEVPAALELEQVPLGADHRALGEPLEQAGGLPRRLRLPGLRGGLHAWSASWWPKM